MSDDEAIIDVPVLNRLPTGAIVTFAGQCATRSLQRFKELWPDAPIETVRSIDRAVGAVGVDRWISVALYEQVERDVAAAFEMAEKANRHDAAHALHVISAAAKSAITGGTAVGLYPGDGVPADESQWWRFKYQAAFNAAGATWFAKRLDLVDPIQADFAVISEIARDESWSQDQKTPPWVLFSREDPEDAPIERRVALAVQDLCVQLAEFVASHGSDALAAIEWRDLERMLAEVLRGVGFEVGGGKGAKDGGKDVIARMTVRGKRLVYYVEIKHWRSGKRVGDREVSSFVEVTLRDGTDGGLFLSTSGYAASVHAQLAEIAEARIRLGNDVKIVSLCQYYVKQRGRAVWEARDVLPKVLLDGTIRLPTSPATIGTTPGAPAASSGSGASAAPGAPHRHHRPHPPRGAT
ncbi:MAG: restriction endonuclease [Gemmatimonadetes bacterium]|nr:restriction endonuclease [Gemmatimonadota bacterium]